MRGLDIGLSRTRAARPGVLAGKYNEGIPSDSRLALSGYEWLRESAAAPERIEAAKQLESIAVDVGCTLAQMALA